MSWVQLLFRMIFRITVLGALTFGLYGMWQLYQNQLQLTYQYADLEQRMMAEEQEVAPQAQVVEKIVSTRQPWSNLQGTLQNAVVQVFSQVAQIDILQPYRAPEQGQVTGTAFFINQEGELATNAHVVDQAKSVWIQIPGMGKQQIDVEVVGVCFDRDLALLRLPEDSKQEILNVLGKINYLELADSDKVYRAEEIMTLGYPLGQQGLKSTVGVVSGREQHLIQIDAAINPGNSGGPSVNIDGKVIGINTSMIMGAQNTGYIIPVNDLKLIIDELRDKPLVRKPFLGILYNNGSESMTNLLNNPQPGGVYVVDVYKGSPLHKAGVQKRDMIYQINGMPVDIYGELPSKHGKISLIDYVSKLKYGQKISIVLYRNGVRKDISFTLDATELLPVRKIYPGYEKIDYEIIGGMLVQPLTMNHIPMLVNAAPGLTRYGEMKHQMEPALVITHIFPDSQAQRCRNLLPGALISELNGKKVKTLDDFRTALYNSVESGHMTIETVDQIYVVMNFEKVLKETQRHARDYFFRLSPLVQDLVAKVFPQQTNQAAG